METFVAYRAQCSKWFPNIEIVNVYSDRRVVNILNNITRSVLFKRVKTCSCRMKIPLGLQSRRGVRISDLLKPEQVW
jgi:hypothetical protein